MTLTAPLSRGDAAEAFSHARLGAALPCRDDIDGVETPGLTSDDWSDDGPREADAAAWCFRACPVREQCLAYALAAREQYGVWGGLTSTERRRRLRRLRRSGL